MAISADPARRWRWATLLAVALIVLACGETERRERFIDGRRLVTEGRYEEALPLLESYLTSAPSGRHASRARFFVAKAFLGLGELDRAAAEFETVVRDYPDSLEAHKSRYKLALLALLAGREEEARRRFAELAESPDGPLAPEARAMSDHLERP